jgi:hypothetical protein
VVLLHDWWGLSFPATLMAAQATAVAWLAAYFVLLAPLQRAPSPHDTAATQDTSAAQDIDALLGTCLQRDTWVSHDTRLGWGAPLRGSSGQFKQGSECEYTHNSTVRRSREVAPNHRAHASPGV